MSVVVGSIKVIDSYNFLPMKLADLPKTFGFLELHKGYFPHKFNTKTNQNYIGRWPHEADYSPEMMKEEDYKIFKIWYNEQIKKVSLDFYCCVNIEL